MPPTTPAEVGGNLAGSLSPDMIVSNSYIQLSLDCPLDATILVAISLLRNWDYSSHSPQVDQAMIQALRQALFPASPIQGDGVGHLLPFTLLFPFPQCLIQVRDYLYVYLPDWSWVGVRVSAPFQAVLEACQRPWSQTSRSSIQCYLPSLPAMPTMSAMSALPAQPSTHPSAAVVLLSGPPVVHSRASDSCDQLSDDTCSNIKHNEEKAADSNSDTSSGAHDVMEDEVVKRSFLLKKAQDLVLKEENESTVCMYCCPDRSTPFTDRGEREQIKSAVLASPRSVTPYRGCRK